MSESPARYEFTPPGAVAWLDVSAEDSNGNLGRTRTGPLGLQITPLRPVPGAVLLQGRPAARHPVHLVGLHRQRCRAVPRPARGRTVPTDGYVHILARVDCPGSVFEPAAARRSTACCGSSTRPRRSSSSSSPTRTCTRSTSRRRRSASSRARSRDMYGATLRADRRSRPSCCARRSSLLLVGADELGTLGQPGRRRPLSRRRSPGCCCAPRSASRRPSSSRSRRCGPAPTRSSTSRPPTRC